MLKLGSRVDLRVASNIVLGISFLNLTTVWTYRLLDDVATYTLRTPSYTHMNTYTHSWLVNNTKSHQQQSDRVYPKTHSLQTNYLYTRHTPIHTPTIARYLTYERIFHIAAHMWDVKTITGLSRSAPPPQIRAYIFVCARDRLLCCERLIITAAQPARAQRGSKSRAENYNNQPNSRGLFIILWSILLVSYRKDWALVTIVAERLVCDWALEM